MLDSEVERVIETVREVVDEHRTRRATDALEPLHPALV
jgi:hypothetical protein